MAGRINLNYAPTSSTKSVISDGRVSRQYRTMSETLSKRTLRQKVER
jgi:hypothetical protein